MCGICGQLQLGAGESADESVVAAMCATLRHRGPDDRGLLVAGRIGLAAARLSIIDIEGGHQPQSNEDGTVWAVQNGEIYNYRELRDRLTARGHAMRTQSDTEVLVHLYEDHGPDFVTHLRGMFAAAIWDARRQRLVLARDRIGIKPLFYAITPEALMFGSEIKALLVAGAPRRLDPLALHDYLSFDYVPAPRTMFEGIRKLPAAHRLVVDEDIRLERYWSFPPQADDAPRASTPELAAELRERLDDAVRAHMVSDVPVGAFLSGGLDSSLVVALMSGHAERPVSTFSIGFEEKTYDELPFARQVAARFGTNHHELIVTPRIADIVDDLVAAFDEPFADSSAIATYYVAQMASQGAKVVMSGDGGDEVFGGYVIYQADRLASVYRRLPALLTERLVPAAAARVPASEGKMSWQLKLARFAANAGKDPLAAHGSWRMIFPEAGKMALYRPEYRHANADVLSADEGSMRILRECFDAYPGEDTLNRFMVVDASVSLVDDMLTKVDRTSMAHSLEVRVPLLDHLLLEWMTVVPSRQKVHRLTLKYLLKQAARELLPAEIVRRPKAGFHVPLPGWLKRELRPLVEEQLGEAALMRQGIFDPAAVRSVVDAHLTGRADRSRDIWGLLMFGLWYDRHLASGRPAA